MEQVLGARCSRSVYYSYVFNTESSAQKISLIHINKHNRKRMQTEALTAFRTIG